MKRFVLPFLLIQMFNSGCSIYYASTAPPHVAVENLKVGAPRTQVLSIMGTPKSIDTTNGEQTEVYEFIDGYHGASKARILLYIAGDLFTLTLAELIFWPMELSVMKGEAGRAVVTYTDDKFVKALFISQKDGTPWKAVAD